MIEVEEVEAIPSKVAKKQRRKNRRCPLQQVEEVGQGPDKNIQVGKRCDMAGCGFITTYNPSNPKLLQLFQTKELAVHMLEAHQLQLSTQPECWKTPPPPSIVLGLSAGHANVDIQARPRN